MVPFVNRAVWSGAVLSGLAMSGLAISAPPIMRLPGAHQPIAERSGNYTRLCCFWSTQCGMHLPSTLTSIWCCRHLWSWASSSPVGLLNQYNLFFFTFFWSKNTTFYTFNWKLSVRQHTSSYQPIRSTRDDFTLHRINATNSLWKVSVLQNGFATVSF